MPEGVTKEPLTVRVSADTARRLRVAAALRPANSRTMGDVIDELAAAHLPAVPPEPSSKKPAPASKKPAKR